MQFSGETVRQESMSVKCVPPQIPRFYSKIGVCRGIPFFLIFAPKHRLWVHVRTASARRFLTCTHNLCFEQKYQIFVLKVFNFYVRKIYILHGRVFVMNYLTVVPSPYDLRC